MTCKTCGLELDNSKFQFVPNKTGGGSYRLECKDCRRPKCSKSNASWYAANRIEKDAYTAAYRTRRRAALATSSAEQIRASILRPGEGVIGVIREPRLSLAFPGRAAEAEDFAKRNGLLLHIDQRGRFVFVRPKNL